MTTKWTAALSSGNEEIDSQHKNILILLEKLILQNETPTITPEFTHAFTEFKQAVQKHFAYEEALLEKSKYKGLKQHKEGHEEIADLLNSIAMSIMLDEKNVPFQM